MKIGEEVLMNPPSRYIFPFAGNHTVDIQIVYLKFHLFNNFCMEYQN